MTDVPICLSSTFLHPVSTIHYALHAAAAQVQVGFLNDSGLAKVTGRLKLCWGLGFASRLPTGHCL
jgi:hypothetical protein